MTWFLVSPLPEDADIPELIAKFSDCLEYTLWANSEVLLSAPHTLREIGLLFINVKGYRSINLRILDSLHGWDVLDRALLRFHTTTTIQCAIWKTYGEWLTGAIETSVPARTIDLWTNPSSEHVGSDEFAALLMRKLPRAMATGRMTIALG